MNEKPWEKTGLLRSEIDDTLKKIVILKQTFGGVEAYNIKLHISEKIIMKVSKMCSLLIEKPSDLNSTANAVRYFLEALIQTTLFLKEPKYVYVVYFSVYTQQINKLQIMIDRIRKEMEILERFEEREKQNNRRIRSKYGDSLLSDDSMAAKYIEETREEQDKLDKEFDSYITVFCNEYKYYGFSFLRHLVEEKALNSYEEQLRKIEDLRDKKSRELLNKDYINILFDFKRQHSKVFSELRDTRSWEQKAKDVGLEEEYKLMYEYTSSIIHCTSYSFLTDLEIGKEEMYFNFNAINSYLYKIQANIKELVNFDKIKIVKIDEE